MGSRAHIDRRKHEVDITEHVLEGGVHVAPLDVDVSPWPLAIVASAVQVQVLAERDDAAEWSDRPRRQDHRRR